MQVVIHRVNSIRELSQIPVYYGVELDIRAAGSELILNHEPFQDGDKLSSYLETYRHSLAIFNIKEAGIEDEVRRLAESAGVRNYFLLDVEFPYIFRAVREGKKEFALRYSEFESIETALNLRGKADWIWIDTVSRLPLDAGSIDKMKGFKTCLVCPERWGRPGDIQPYRQELKRLNFPIDAVMTSFKHRHAWEGLSPQSESIA